MTITRINTGTVAVTTAVTTVTSGAFNTAAGDLVYAVVSHNAGNTFNGVMTDSAGNSYTPLGTVTDGNIKTTAFYCLSSLAKTGNVISAGFTGSSICTLAWGQYRTTVLGGFLYDTKASLIPVYDGVPVATAPFNTAGPGVVVAGLYDLYTQVETLTDYGSLTIRSKLDGTVNNSSVALSDAIYTSAQTGLTAGVNPSTYGRQAVYAASFVEAPLAPRIDSQPTQQSVAVGSTATFTVAATSSGGSLSYQWYSAPITSLFSNVPGTWSAIPGETGASYTTPAASSGDNGAWFYCSVTDSSATVKTAAVRMFLLGTGSTGMGAAGGGNGLVGWASARRSRGGRAYEMLLPAFGASAAWSDWFGVSKSSSSWTTISTTAAAASISTTTAALVSTVATETALPTNVAPAVVPIQMLGISAVAATGQGTDVKLLLTLGAGVATSGPQTSVVALVSTLAAAVGAATVQPAPVGLVGVLDTAPAAPTSGASQAGLVATLGLAVAGMLVEAMPASFTGVLSLLPTSTALATQPVGLAITLGLSPATSSWQGSIGSFDDAIVGLSAQTTWQAYPVSLVATQATTVVETIAEGGGQLSATLDLLPAISTWQVAGQGAPSIDTIAATAAWVTSSVAFSFPGLGSPYRYGGAWIAPFQPTTFVAAGDAFAGTYGGVYIPPFQPTTWIAL